MNIGWKVQSSTGERGQVNGKQGRRQEGLGVWRPADVQHDIGILHTRAVQAGIDLVTLAAMLGHSKINMVLRYAHPTQEHQTKAMDKMEQYVSEQKIAHAERAAPQMSYVVQ